MLATTSLSTSKHQSHHCIHSKTICASGLHPSTTGLTASPPGCFRCRRCYHGGSCCEQHWVRCCNGCKSCCQLPSPHPAPETLPPPQLSAGPLPASCGTTVEHAGDPSGLQVACRGFAAAGWDGSKVRVPVGGGEGKKPCPLQFYHLNGKMDAKGILHPGGCGATPPPHSATSTAAWCFQGGALPLQWLWWGLAAGDWGGSCQDLIFDLRLVCGKGPRSGGRGWGL